MVPLKFALFVESVSFLSVILGNLRMVICCVFACVCVCVRVCACVCDGGYHVGLAGLKPLEEDYFLVMYVSNIDNQKTTHCSSSSYLMHAEVLMSSLFPLLYGRYGGADTDVGKPLTFTSFRYQFCCCQLVSLVGGHLHGCLIARQVWR